MQSPVQITFRDMSPSPAIAAHVEKRAAKLDTFFDRIVSCHVVVEAPHRHSKHGKRFHVRIDLHLPGKELVVSKNPDDAREDAWAAINDAFGDAERVLEEFATLHKVDTKIHLKNPHGVVVKLFPDRGYGSSKPRTGARSTSTRTACWALASTSCPSARASGSPRRTVTTARRPAPCTR
jgi:ribosomal subunit interface protein